MAKLKNRCAHCGGKFGLVCQQHWRLRFCRKACKDKFLAKMAKEYALMRKWLGWLPHRTTYGNQRTLLGLRAMSAFPPKADIEADIAFVRLVPIADILRLLFDHRVSTCEQRRWDCKPERFGGL